MCIFIDSPRYSHLWVHIGPNRPQHRANVTGHGEVKSDFTFSNETVVNFSPQYSQQWQCVSTPIHFGPSLQHDHKRVCQRYRLGDAETVPESDHNPDMFNDLPKLLDVYNNQNVGTRSRVLNININTPDPVRTSDERKS